jgi:FkbM family methyltransferase
VFHFLKETIKPGAVVLEVGANIGVFSVLMARWAGRNGMVHAFEPSPVCCEALTFHLDLNGVTDRVVVERAALSNSEGTATFYCAGTSGTNSLSGAHINTDFGSIEQTEVRVTTVDSYCFANRVSPFLIKIDVEGFEFHVLEGAFDILKRCRPVILVEFHPLNWADIGVCPDSTMSVLGELGYRAKALSGQRNIVSEYGHVVFEPSA